MSGFASFAVVHYISSLLRLRVKVVIIAVSEELNREFGELTT